MDIYLDLIINLIKKYINDIILSIRGILMIKINNEDGSNYIKRVYERDFKMMSSIVFNSLLNKKSESNNYNKLYRFATEDIMW